MKLTCNIDQRGRKARLLTGLVVDLTGVALIVTGWLTSDKGMLIAGVIASLAGGFMIFEGVAGWCVLRTLGFKTKI